MLSNRDLAWKNACFTIRPTFGNVQHWSEVTDHWIHSWKLLHQQCSHVVRVQYIPRNMHTVFALLCFVVIHWLIFPYPSGLLHWHCGNLTIAPVPAKQPWWIWINTSCEFIMNDCITTTKQSTTKPCAYFLGYTVFVETQNLTRRKIISKQRICGPRTTFLLPSEWASKQIRKIAGYACAGNAGNVFIRHRLQRKSLVCDTNVRDGTCVTYDSGVRDGTGVTHVTWCMSGSL